MSSLQKNFTVVLAGNPNCGKTVLFNALTGSNQRVGNWSGVTVEKKTGQMIQGDKTFSIIDLPGLYSLSVATEQSIDERIACDFLLKNKIDLIVNVIDAANLERNLYLTLQLLELKIPIILAVNMLDVSYKRGIDLNLPQLSDRLDCPVVGLVARQGQGLQELRSAIYDSTIKSHTSKIEIPLSPEINNAVNELALQLNKEAQLATMQRPAWWALRLLEQDHYAMNLISDEIKNNAQQNIQAIAAKNHEPPDILIADARYEWAHLTSEKISTRISTGRKTVTQWIDRIVLNRYLGIPIFLCSMYLMFLFAVNLAGAFQDFFDIGSSVLLVDGVDHVMTLAHLPVWLIAVIAHGIGKGINTTITFIPVIGGFFLFLSFLEDSGYMARAAFVMDRLMRALGLPGKAFVPMIVGFGCNVPAVMGARTLQNPKERILAAMMMPFMSCGARLAIFAVFAACFFQKGGAEIIFSLYLIGIFAAILTGLLLRKTLLPGDAVPLVMELPPYHLPKWNVIFRVTGYRLKNFLSRASRVIIPVCILIGALNSITTDGKLITAANQTSLLAAAGQVVTPIFAPMGITQNNWPATVGLVTGVLAKEVVIGTLNSLYSQVAHLNINHQIAAFNLWQGLQRAVVSIPQNLATLADAIRNPIAANEAPYQMDQAVFGVMFQQFSGKMSAFAYLLFVLLYFPCISTLAALRREVGNRWANFSMAWSMLLAYGVAIMVFQLGTFMRHPLHSSIWIGLFLSIFIVFFWGLRFVARGKHVSPVSSVMLQEKNKSCCGG